MENVNFNQEGMYVCEGEDEFERKIVGAADLTVMGKSLPAI